MDFDHHFIKFFYEIIFNIYFLKYFIEKNMNT